LSQHVKGVHGKKKEFATKTELKEAAIKKKPKETLEQEEGRLTILDQIEQLCASAGKSLTTGIEFQELESETTATSFSATESVQEMESGTNTTSFSATESDLYLESLGPLQDEEAFGDDIVKKRKYLFGRLDKILLESTNCDCKVCGKSFENLTKLFNHIFEGHQIRKFYCEICKKQFGKRKNLNEHITHVHCPDRKWKCEKCNKSFSRNYILSIHLKSKTAHS
jgi:hypothetical protein